MDLSQVPTQELMKALLSRTDLIDERGMTVYPEGYELMTKLTPLPCIDGIPIRINEDGELEAALIKRSRGMYRGRYAMIGGRIAFGGMLFGSLKAHFATDLGTKMSFLWIESTAGLRPFPPRPIYVGMYLNHPYSTTCGCAEEHCYDPTKQALGLTYLVALPKTGELQFGSNAQGLQEAAAFEWFTWANKPLVDQFGYRHDIPWVSSFAHILDDPIVRKALTERETYLDF